MQSLQQQQLRTATTKASPVPHARINSHATRHCPTTQPRLSAACSPLLSKLRIVAQPFGVQQLSSIVAKAAEGNGVALGTEKTTKPLPIVFVSAEVAPWSKTGGLGDVVGGLPIELAKRGHKVITVAPRYDQYSDAWDTSVVIDIDGEPVRFFHSIKKGVHRVWVDHPWFLAKVWGKTGSKLYGPKTGADYTDNHKRFALFCKAAIEAPRVLPFGFGEDVVFVANDWHSALVPVLLKDVYQPRGEFKNAKVALAIHNIAFQGRMWEENFKDTGLPESSRDKFAFQDGYPKVYTELDPLEEDELPKPSKGPFKKVNWLKAGILAADKLLTVSPNYATEISADASGGVELDEFIRAKGVEGIVNGMDVEEWDPRVDKYLTIKYDKTNVYAGKAAAKEVLQADVGLPVDPKAPLFAFIGRLEEQKGVDILLAAIPKILAKAPNAQVVVLGTGKAKFEKQVNAIDKEFKGKAVGVVKFSAPLAHLMTAGADFILVPSRFEPCGLIQLHAMQYGTVPVVASTGGLVDTVKEGVTGFHIGALDKDELLPEDAEALAATCARAAQVFATPLFKDLVYNAISQDLSWSKPAQKWEGILENLYLGTSPESVKKSESIKIPVKEKIPAAVAATDKPLSAPVPTARTPAMVGGTAAPPAFAAAPAPIGAPSTNGTAASAPSFAPSFASRPTSYSGKATSYSGKTGPAPTTTPSSSGSTAGLNATATPSSATGSSSSAPSAAATAAPASTATPSPSANGADGAAAPAAAAGGASTTTPGAAAAPKEPALSRPSTAAR